MKPGDIVRTLHDLTPLNDHPIPSGTRMRLVAHRTTNAGRRWTADDKHNRRLHDIPEDAIEVIA